MCYSKEVSLVAATAIASGNAFSLWRYYLKQGVSKLVPHLRPFALILIASSLAIGGHQLFEYLAVDTGSQVIYKIGLILSISSTYFLVRSLELLARTSFGSRIVALVILAVALEMAWRPMVFADKHFWVSGQSHFVWGAAWLLLFLYWNAAACLAARDAQTPSHRQLLLRYPWYALNVSFVLSLIYGYGAAFLQRAGDAACTVMGTFGARCSPFEAFHPIYDSPSVWCVFASIHAFLIPLFLRQVERHQHHIPETGPYRTLPVSREAQLLLLAVLLFLLLFITLPFFPDIAVKMVTK